ncbi:hypothetical protein Nepgr_028177 [Nepenthes gracilis]|uniref:Uncharacterized protein n=1 Tax=Nepenthes gracilis TaxID=150966 RepID=A0AAD3TBP9_NEPGR|nr:hypothetical protein Nepgr_028177 [Nepenthes gracilis]
MPRISAEVIVHKLGLDASRKPVRQKRRNHSVEKLVAIREEVKRLLDAGFIRAVQYPEWLSNDVLVKKSSGKWRMYIDFTDVNKAYPKDSFPLPRIDQLKDSTSRHELLSFMDAYSGYNQIRIDPEDEEHTSFMTDQGTYCYKMMPFGLKNAGATYQRLVNKMFKAQIGRNVEVYVDDMLVKSKVASHHVNELDETFQILRRHGMKLNPVKCTFGVTSGKFLGFIKLTGRIAALSRFLAKSAEKYLPFFKALRGTKSHGFKWNEECDEAFSELKTYLSSAPLLSSPHEGEDLYLYLATSTSALSSVLVAEHEGKQQPVYYVSRVLTDVEARYPHAEKMALVLVYAARKLRPYFQSHRIVVLTDQPLKSILQKPETLGRLVKWAVELGEFDLEFRPRPALKGQALADFIVEAAMSAREEDSNPGGTEGDDSPTWTLNVDGSSTQTGSGAGIVLRTPEGVEIVYSVTLAFPATNNVAEYEALLAGLRLARECSVRLLVVRSDSELVVNQVKGNFEASNPQLVRYLAKVRALIPEFGQFEIEHILRSDNERADRLAGDAAARTVEQYAREPREVQNVPSIDAEDKEVLHVNTMDNWMTPYVRFLTEETLPEDVNEAKRIKKTAGWYTVLSGRLYRRGYSTPLLKCLTPEEADYALAEVHLGLCGSHIGGKNLAFNVMRQGFYWPTMKRDAMEFVRKCESCQVHGNMTHQPHTELHYL